MQTAQGCNKCLPLALPITAGSPGGVRCAHPTLLADFFRDKALSTDPGICEACGEEVDDRRFTRYPDVENWPLRNAAIPKDPIKGWAGRMPSDSFLLVCSRCWNCAKGRERAVRVKAGEARALAHRATRNAMRRGELVKPEVCEDCGTITRQLQFHHTHGYTKKENWLRGVWLCKPCHHHRHGQSITGSSKTRWENRHKYSK